jgi:hypothetical protein
MSKVGIDALNLIHDDDGLDDFSDNAKWTVEGG